MEGRKVAEAWQESIAQVGDLGVGVGAEVTEALSTVGDVGSVFGAYAEGQAAAIAAMTKLVDGLGAIATGPLSSEIGEAGNLMLRLEERCRSFSRSIIKYSKQSHGSRLICQATNVYCCKGNSNISKEE